MYPLPTVDGIHVLEADFDPARYTRKFREAPERRECCAEAFARSHGALCLPKTCAGVRFVEGEPALPPPGPGAKATRAMSRRGEMIESAPEDEGERYDPQEMFDLAEADRLETQHPDAMDDEVISQAPAGILVLSLLGQLYLCLRLTSDHLFVIRASWPLDSRCPSRTLLAAKAKDMDAAARANRANQMNPNYSSHRKKKGPATAAGPSPPKKDKQAHAQNKARARKHANNFGNRARALKPRDKVHEPSLKKFSSVLRGVCGSGAHIIKKGSRRKGTAIPGSDLDYHIKTERQISIDEREQIMANSEARGLDITVRKAFTVHPPEGPSIDFFPPDAEWHDGVQVQAPRHPPMRDGRRNAIKKLKEKKYRRKAQD
ncbi:Kif9 [Symbiodinium sp. CCMP2592]|nr:Kif9 [Symbiodinium sp. CCMP2592]